jgi:hypothetical protein
MHFMQSKTKLLRTLGIIFFSTGVLVGIIMFVLMNWAYFEANFFFGYTAPAEKTLTTLRCPLLMTTSDTGAVNISITNNSDRDLEPLIRTEISYFGAAKSERTNYSLAAGETRRLSWTVTSDDMVFGHLILARVFVYSTYTLASRTNSCGTVVVDLPGLTGIQLFVIVLVLSLAGMTAGWSLWLAGSRPLHAEGLIAMRAMVILTIVVLLGILAGMIGWWGVGLICTVGSVLLIYTVVGYYIQKA